MNQVVWLSMVQVEAVNQPRVDEHEGIKAKAKGGVVRTMAQRNDGADNHPADDEDTNDDTFTALWCHDPFLSALREVLEGQSAAK
jgi:hypothetical protein